MYQTTQQAVTAVRSGAVAAFLTDTATLQYFAQAWQPSATMHGRGVAFGHICSRWLLHEASLRLTNLRIIMPATCQHSPEAMALRVSVAVAAVRCDD